MSKKKNKISFSEPISIFKSNGIKIVFSDSQIQPHDEYGFVKDEKGIMHHYYMVTGYTKVNKKWNIAFNTYIYDFPNLMDFKEMLRVLVKGEISLQNYQKTEYWKAIQYSYTQYTSYMGTDHYSVTHIINKVEGEEDKEYFKVNIGGSKEEYPKRIISVSYDHLNREELNGLYECIEKFFRMTIDCENKKIIERNKAYIQSWKTSDKRLFNLSANGNAINTIYTIGDEVDITVLRGDLNTNTFSSENYENTEIKDVLNDSIIITGGYIEDSQTGNYVHIEDVEIPINTLLYMFHSVSDDKLHFNEDEIADDFIKLLTDDEKAEFKEGKTKTLYEKWKEAILNRTWMCREEHNLPKRKKDEGHHENVYACIKYIIGLIKEKV